MDAPIINPQMTSKKIKNSLKADKIKRELCKLRKSKTFQNLGDALDYFSD